MFKQLNFIIFTISVILFFLSGYILGVGQNLNGGYSTVREIQLDNN